MPVPSHYLSRPQFDLSSAVRNEFDELFAQSIRNGSGDFIEYSSSVPKWQFLSYLGDTRDVVFHGTGDPEITEFEPRQSNDSSDFGNQKAVYAASDALWSTYFAVVDRPRYVWSLVNSCFRLLDPKNGSVPHYFFSINADALPHKPWRTGTVYVLPRDSFEQQPLQKSQSSGLVKEVAHWRSFDAVKPLAKISMGPEDFPFLDQVRGHDVAVIQQRVKENPDGFPWVDE